MKRMIATESGQRYDKARAAGHTSRGQQDGKTDARPLTFQPKGGHPRYLVPGELSR
ncbi:hypothetical protein [Mesorhizobium sp. L103C119B0]|uniref:hypothetical protein n=1 Tax=Mesorhizobium sp. L103C119B0 TaxID=1287085 RepID=UPI0012DEB675|nr:hypothetical protein [Mesorhizobium sp. L103C119B0]